MHKEMVDRTMMRLPQVRSHPDPDRESATKIEIVLDGRWDALALYELLIPYRSFLVQHDHERWVIHAQAPGRRGESLSQALAAIDDWGSGRDLRIATCSVGGRPYDLHGTRAA